MVGELIRPRTILFSAIAMIVAVIIVPIAAQSAKPPCPNSTLATLSPPRIASPCPGNSLNLAASNILTADLGDVNGANDAVRVWQAASPTNYQMVWFSENGGPITDVLVGDADNDGAKEVLAFRWTTVNVPVGTETRIFFDVFEQGSTGFPSAQSPYFVDVDGWTTDAFLANVDTDPEIEIVTVTSHRVVVYSYRGTAYGIEFNGPAPSDLIMNYPDWGDVSGDGQPEIVTPTNRGTVLVWTLQLDGSWAFLESQATEPARPIYKVGVGNIDDDLQVEIVGLSNDPNTKLTYLFAWELAGGAYSLSSSQDLDLAGDSRGWGMDLADLTGDGKRELILGTTGDPRNEKAMVLAFTATGWTVSWETLNSAVTNEVFVGDADGSPSSTELVFAGMYQQIGKGGRIKTSLYIEVFAWSAGSASPSWKFSGSFSEAWAADLG